MHCNKFSRNTLLSYIFVSQKFKLIVINAKFLLPMIFRNEPSITLSTLWTNLPKSFHMRTITNIKTSAKIEVTTPLHRLMESRCCVTANLRFFSIRKP